MKIADIMQKLRMKKMEEERKENCQILFCCLVVLAAFFNFLVAPLVKTRGSLRRNNSLASPAVKARNHLKMSKVSPLGSRRFETKTF